MFGMDSIGSALPQPEAIRPALSLLTDVGRKYPGFPTPLSPTPSARKMFPTPISEFGSGAATPRMNSPAPRTTSPMSIDGSEMCGPSRRCDSHGYEHYASQMSLIDGILSSSNNQSEYYIPSQLRSPSRAPSSSSRSITNPTSPTGPSRCVSPRTAMLKNMVNKQAMQDLSYRSPTFSNPSPYFRPCNMNAYLYAPPTPPLSIRSLSPLPLSNYTSPQSPSIQIANGTETNTSSPIDPSGTMLLYTSNRSVDSGLLGVRPLSEA